MSPAMAGRIVGSLKREFRNVSRIMFQKLFLRQAHLHKRELGPSAAVEQRPAERRGRSPQGPRRSG
jgi:hypothetical protein